MEVQRRAREAAEAEAWRLRAEAAEFGAGRSQSSILGPWTLGSAVTATATFAAAALANALGATEADGALAEGTVRAIEATADAADALAEGTVRTMNAAARSVVSTTRRLYDGLSDPTMGILSPENADLIEDGVRDILRATRDAVGEYSNVFAAARGASQYRIQEYNQKHLPSS